MRQGDDDAGRAGLVLELRGRSGGDDLALVDDDDVVGQVVGLLEVLRGEQKGRALADQPAQHLPQLGAAAGVEPGGGLVEEQHRRGGDEADREVEAATHAAGVLLGDPVGGLGEREPLEQLVGAGADVVLGQPVQPADEPEVLAGR